MPTLQHRLVRAFVELADTLVDDFDVTDLLHTLVERLMQSFEIAAVGLMLADEEGKLTVRQIEELARRAADGSQEKTRTKEAPDPNLAALAQELQALLGTRVQLRGSHRRGQLIVAYASATELDLLVRRLRGGAPPFEAFEREDESDTLTV